MKWKLQAIIQSHKEVAWIYLLDNYNTLWTNNRVYPYFDFDDDNAFDFDLTLRASCVIWAFELASSAITRTIYKKVFNHNISREAMKDFKTYPEMVFTMIVIIIHVLQVKTNV